MPRGRFLSDDPRVYAAIPVTAHKGDVVDWPNGLPDSLWEDAGSAPVTKGPDNAPDLQPVSEAPIPVSVTDPASDPTDSSEPEPPAENPAAEPAAQ